MFKENGGHYYGILLVGGVEHYLTADGYRTNPDGSLDMVCIDHGAGNLVIFHAEPDEWVTVMDGYSLVDAMLNMEPVAQRYPDNSLTLTVTATTQILYSIED